MQAYILIKRRSGSENKTISEFSELKQIVETNGMWGQYDILPKIPAADPFDNPEPSLLRNGFHPRKPNQSEHFPVWKENISDISKESLLSTKLPLHDLNCCLLKTRLVSKIKVITLFKA